MTYPDSATVLFKLAERPTFKSDTLDMKVGIYSENHQRLAARCIETNAIYDYNAAKKTTLPGFMVEKFQDTYDKQLQSKEECYLEAHKLIREVTELETVERVK